LLTMLEILLVVTVYRTFKKGVKKYKNETVSLAKRRDIESTTNGSATDAASAAIELTAVGGEDEDEEDGLSKTSDKSPLTPVDDDGSVKNQELQEILAREARIVPLEKIVLISAVWVLIMILALMRGGHGAASIVGIESCSAGYWILTFLVIPMCVGVTLWVGRRLRREHREKVRLGYEFQEGMVQWDARNSIVYPLCCFFAGCAAGLLGIGGGLVLGPMLLEMNVRAEVSAATSSLMVLFTASCTSIQFAILGQLDIEYALWLGAFTSAGAVVGVLAVQYAVKKLGRPSAIILSLATVILASAILIPSFAIPDLISDVNEEGSDALKFHSFCDCAG